MISQPKHQTFKVFVRCRPLNEKQSMLGGRKRSVSIIQPSIINLIDTDGRQSTFNFDYVFNQQYTNQELFNKTVQPLIKHFVDGYNSTVFAYGITGAGKSFTMFGNYYQSNSTPGLIPLTFNYLLNTLNLKECKLKMSYIQIYNQQIFDLLNDQSQNLQIIQDPQKGVVVLDLQERKVNDIQQISQLIIDGNNRRVMAQTNANDFSSRSHAIVLITLQRKIDQKIVTAKLSLVDLAGSEKASVHQSKGIRILEGSNINKSLLALGNCINSLSDNNKKNSFVPYRDSKLTRLLKDSLGGNTKTVMIACISQSSLFHDQTLNTLKYAGRAKKIQKIVHQNIKQSNNIEIYKEQIQKLKKQNELLKSTNKNCSTIKLKQKRINIENIVSNLVENLRESIMLEQKMKNSENNNNILKILNHKLKEKQYYINSLISVSLQENINPNLPTAQINITTVSSKSPSPPKVIRAKSAFKQKQNKLPLPMQLQQMRSRAKKANRYITNLFDKGLTQSEIDLNRVDYMLKPCQSEILHPQKQKILVPREGKFKRQQLNINPEPCVLSLNKSMKRSKHLDSLRQIQKINQKLASLSKIKNSVKQYEKKSNINFVCNDNGLQII